MKERIVRFGPGNCLVGAITEPDEARRRVGAPAVFILTAGLLHKVGPFRMHVDLARRLADDGFTVLRFDMSGIGDSGMRHDAEADRERAVRDIRDAIDWMQRTKNIDRAVIAGLCLGAYNGHNAAVIDERIVGAVFLDGYGYHTLGYYARHYGPRLLKPACWTNALKRLFNRGGSGAQESLDERRIEDDVYFSTFPPREQVAGEVHAFAKRGMKMLFYFSGGQHELNDAKQFEEMYGKMPAGTDVEIIYDRAADHTYMLQAERERMLAHVRKWIGARYVATSATERLEVAAT